VADRHGDQTPEGEEALGAISTARSVRTELRLREDRAEELESEGLRSRGGERRLVSSIISVFDAASRSARWKRFGLRVGAWKAGSNAKPAPSGIGGAGGSFGAGGASAPSASGCGLRIPNTASAAAGCGWDRSNRSRLSGLEQASGRSGPRGPSGPRGADRCPTSGDLRIGAQRAERLVRRGGRLRPMASADRVDARLGCVSAQTDRTTVRLEGTSVPES
jgi:hypothetical protein